MISLPLEEEAIAQKVTLTDIKAGLSGDEALLAAFEENARDIARIGGS